MNTDPFEDEIGTIINNNTVRIEIMTIIRNGTPGETTIIILIGWKEYQL